MKRLNNQGGQLVVEAVLLLAVGAFLSTMIVNYLKDNQFAQNLVAKPWSMMSGMVECGVWAECGKGQSGKHPGTRINSLKPDGQ